MWLDRLLDVSGVWIDDPAFIALRGELEELAERLIPTLSELETRLDELEDPRCAAAAGRIRAALVADEISVHRAGALTWTWTPHGQQRVSFTADPGAYAGFTVLTRGQLISLLVQAEERPARLYAQRPDGWARYWVPCPLTYRTGGKRFLTLGARFADSVDTIGITLHSTSPTEVS